MKQTITMLLLLIIILTAFAAVGFAGYFIYLACASYGIWKVALILASGFIIDSFIRCLIDAVKKEL